MAKTKFEIIRESAKKTPAPWKFDAQTFVLWNKKEIYTDSPRTESGSFYRVGLQYTESWNISGQIPTIRVYRYTPCNPGEENTLYTLVQIYKQTTGETQKQRNFNYLLKLAPTLDIEALFKRAIEEDTGKAYNDLSDFWATPENAPEAPEEATPEEIPTAEATTPDRATEAAPDETDRHYTTCTPETVAEETTEAENTPTEPEQLSDNYYIENKETGKIELHFEKSYYMSLPDEKKKDIKSNFLFSRHSGAWISRRKFPNLYWPRKVAESLGLYNAGSEGERRTFSEQMEVKAAKAEHRAERMDARANKATAHGQSLQAPINRMHGDIAFFTQPNINTSAGRAFTRQRERMWTAWERGIEELRKSDYYRERAEAARATASQTKTTDKGFCQRRIDEANKTIRAQKKNIAHYEKQLARIESGETVTRWNGEMITTEEINNWLEDASDILIAAYGKVAYYDALIEAAGGIIDKTSVKPGDIVKIRWKEPVRIISTRGNKNFTYEFTDSHMRYADGSQMRGQAAYAEIKEIVSAV